MSIRHSDKCTPEESLKFKTVVKKWFENQGLVYSKIIALRSFGGTVKVFTGGTVSRMPQRMRRIFVETTPTGGKYLLTNGPITEPEYFSFYRDEWEDDLSNVFIIEAVKKMFAKKINEGVK